MRILYVLNSGQPGGMEQHVLDLVKGMLSKGHTVYVWCAQGPIVEWYSGAGAKVIAVSVGTDIDLRYIFSLRNFLKANKIDVMHAHELKVVINALLAAFLARTKVRISHTHTPISEWRVPNFKKLINSKINALVVNWLSTKEIALTQSRLQIKAKEGIRTNKLVVIPNCLDVSEFNFSTDQKKLSRSYILEKYSLPPENFIFGVVARTSEEKGHEVLINAFEGFVRRLEDPTKASLILAGGGPLEGKVRELVLQKGLQSQVKITGRFSAEDHKKYFAAFDCFVFPTLAEGFGIVLTEAMASKLPAVVSDLPVLKEVGGDTITYFKTGDANDLEQKLLAVYRNVDSFSQLAQRAYRRVQDLFSVSKFTESYEKLYKDLLG